MDYKSSLDNFMRLEWLLEMVVETSTTSPTADNNEKMYTSKQNFSLVQKFSDFWAGTVQWSDIFVWSFFY